MTLAALAAFARRGRGEREACELCACTLAEAHGHVVDRDGRIHCVCNTCGRADWTRVATVVASISPPSDRVWAALEVPVALAFIVRTSAGTPVIRYPSPAGLAQGNPSTHAWDAVCAELPITGLVPEVEAILVDRRAAPAAYRVSIDRCYELAGLLRARGDIDPWFAALAGACRRA
jgi:hypothetical protein